MRIQSQITFRKQGRTGANPTSAATPFWFEGLPVLKTCNSSTIPSFPPPNTTISSLIDTARWPCLGRGEGPVEFVIFFHFMVAAMLFLSGPSQRTMFHPQGHARCVYTKQTRTKSIMGRKEQGFWGGGGGRCCDLFILWKQKITLKNIFIKTVDKLFSIKNVFFKILFLFYFSVFLLFVLRAL